MASCMYVHRRVFPRSQEMLTTSTEYGGASGMCKYSEQSTGFIFSWSVFLRSHQTPTRLTGAYPKQSADPALA